MLCIFHNVSLNADGSPEAWHPDIIFIHNSYDNQNYITSVDSRYYSSNLKKCTDKLVYIPYFVLDEPCSEENVKGEQRFSYCYVADAISGLLYAMFLGKCGEAYNVADTKGAISLREIAENIAEAASKKVIFDLPDEEEANGFSKVTTCVMDTRKLQKLGWQAFDDVLSGTKKTVEILREQRI